MAKKPKPQKKLAPGPAKPNPANLRKLTVTDSVMHGFRTAVKVRDKMVKEYQSEHGADCFTDPEKGEDHQITLTHLSMGILEHPAAVVVGAHMAIQTNVGKITIQDPGDEKRPPGEKAAVFSLKGTKLVEAVDGFINSWLEANPEGEPRPASEGSEDSSDQPS